jgi:polyhydroxyalkanoate synthase
MQQFHDTVESSIDPLGMAAPLLHAQLAWAAHPQELTEAMAKVSASLWELQWHSWRRMLGLPSPDPVTPHGDDPRFADPVWVESPTWDVAKEWYLLFTHHVQDMLYDTPGLSQKERRRAAFWWRNWLNAVAPPNFCGPTRSPCVWRWSQRATVWQGLPQFPGGPGGRQHADDRPG